LKIVLILISVLLGASGQLMFKGAVNGKGCSTIIETAKCSIASPLFWGGAGVYFISLILWMKVLADNDLSYARPFAGAGYVVTAVLAWLIFAEQIPVIRWIGIIFIVTGIFFVAKS